jgi:Holliday junction DNA helicase RuvA
MVDYLIGVIKQAGQQEIIVDLGMVGLTLHVSDSKSFEVGVQHKVYSYMHWNAESGPSFYGFALPLDRSVFCVIISCSGIGPKIALAILAQLGAQGFLHAITTGDEQILSSVSGIGKKKAEQIIVALKHKVATLMESGVDMGIIQHSSHFHDVSQALLSLHYSRQEVTRAMDYLKKNTTGGEGSFDHLLRHALSYLSKQL